VDAKSCRCDNTWRTEIEILALVLIVRKLIKYDTGVLSATTAFGKTVIGAWMIVACKVNTLVLVHRQELLDQWRRQVGSPRL
jgi:superfamily II DNA or RNA helicase